MIAPRRHAAFPLVATAVALAMAGSGACEPKLPTNLSDDLVITGRHTSPCWPGTPGNPQYVEEFKFSYSNKTDTAILNQKLVDIIWDGEPPKKFKFGAVTFAVYEPSLKIHLAWIWNEETATLKEKFFDVLASDEPPGQFPGTEPGLTIESTYFWSEQKAFTISDSISLSQWSRWLHDNDRIKASRSISTGTGTQMGNRFLTILPLHAVYGSACETDRITVQTLLLPNEHNATAQVGFSNFLHY
ncbi:MAG: hypothetical protein ABI579_00435, partial [Candidatus Sumerlaeota bacterium]